MSVEERSAVSNHPHASGLLRRLAASGSRGLARYVPTKPFVMKNKEPIVSFTFDDVPDSAYANGARILDGNSVRGTFYIAPGICGTRDAEWSVISADDVLSLYGAGHEIGCHTYHHLKVQSLSREVLARETRQSFERLRDICGPLPLNNFAYPFGSVSFPRKLELDRTFKSCRSIYSGFNSGLIDLGMLRTHELYDRTSTEEAIAAILDHAMKANAWVIFYTHDVADRPSWIGCSPGHLERVVKAARARGIACLAIDEALNRIGA